MNNFPKISDEVKKVCKKRNIKIRTGRKSHGYKKEALIVDGCNILEYFGMVRRYTQWRYKIDNETFELFCYLFPRPYFTKKEYSYYPMRWGYHRFDNLVEQGWIVNMFPEKQRYRIYTLSPSAKILVINAHKMLSGEMRIPAEAHSNPAFREDANYNKKRYRTVMEDMREFMEWE